MRAGEIVAGVALGRVGRALADVARRLGDELPAVADEIALRAGRQLGEIVPRVPVRRPSPQDVAGARARLPPRERAAAVATAHRLIVVMDFRSRHCGPHEPVCLFYKNIRASCADPRWVGCAGWQLEKTVRPILRGRRTNQARILFHPRRVGHAGCATQDDGTKSRAQTPSALRLAIPGWRKR